MPKIKGRVFVYGDDINTDVIFPGKYTYTVTDPEEMAKHAFEDLDPDFVNKVRPGDIIVAGKNFGCGSSREQAAFCLKYNNVGAVVAESFARIYFRNCINAGLLAIEVKEISKKVKNGDVIEIDTDEGIVKLPNGETVRFPALPPEVDEIMKAGGLEPYIRKKLEEINKE